jgi:hypothetical protein
MRRYPFHPRTSATFRSDTWAPTDGEINFLWSFIQGSIMSGARCWRNFRELLKMRSQTLPGTGCKKAASLPRNRRRTPRQLNYRFSNPAL